MGRGGSNEVPWWTSWRFAIAWVGFLGFIHLYAQRVGMSVAIVAMVNHTAVAALDAEGGSSSMGSSNDGNVSVGLGRVGLYNITGGIDEDDEDEDVCVTAVTGNNTAQASEDGEFVWQKEMQGHILGSFFYGYLVSQIPAGMLAERFGAKWVMAIFLGMSTICTLLIPLAARVGGVIFIVILRVISGIGSGAAYPTMMAVWGHWAPPTERTKLSNITYAGAWMGNVLALPLSGVLCKYGFAGGWPSVFYVIGGSSVVWLIIWCLLVANTPEDHTRISKVEKDYIHESLKGQIKDTKTEARRPWGKILTSGPVWAIIIGCMTTDWGLYTFFTNTPTYFYEVLKLDVTSNGFYSALPFLGLWVNMNVSSWIADKLISSKVLSIGATRKCMLFFGSGTAACFILGLSFLNCTQPKLAIGILTAGITVTASVYSGWMTNPMDIAPKYAGTIMGLANGLGAITGFIAPVVVAALTKNRTASDWQKVFFLTAGIYVFGAIFFAIFASGEVQDWAKDDEDVAEEEEKHGLTDTAKDTKV